MKTIRFLLLVTLAAGIAACSSGPKPKAVDDEKNPQYQYDKAAVSMRYGLVDEAVRYAHLALELDPNFHQAWNLLGLAHFQRKAYAEAAAAFEQALAVKPDFGDAAYNLGRVFQEMDELEKAEAEFGRAETIAPDFRTAYSLAELLYRRNKLEAALESVQKAIARNDRSAAAYNLQGVVLNQLTRHPEAVASFRQGLEVAPEDVNIQVNLGIALINTEQNDQARAIFEKALPRIKEPGLREKVEKFLQWLKDRG